MGSSPRSCHALGTAALLLAACGDAFSSASDAGSSSPADGSSLDGSGGGPDSSSDAGSGHDGAPHDSAIPDATAIDAVAVDSSAHDAVAGGCDAAAATLRVFVTAQQFSAPAVGGLAGADTICQSAAANAGLKGTFVAWLSGGGSNALDRVCATTASFVLVDGTTVVAKGTTGLTSGQLLHAIDVTEKGEPAPVTPTACGDTRLAVWTGTKATGMGQANYDCHDWTTSSAIATGAVGFAQATDGAWTYGCSGVICGGSASLYCIEQ